MARYKVSEIKEMNNDSLILVLCNNMFDNTKGALITQERICKELESRNVIRSAEILNDKLNL